MRTRFALTIAAAMALSSITACTPQAPRPSAEQVIAAIERNLAEADREARRIKPLLDQGKTSEAEAELQTMHMRNAFLAGATRTKLSELLAAEGKVAVALALLDRGEATEPRNLGYRSARFVVLMGSGQPALALQQAPPEPETASNFVRPGAYLRRALAYLALGRLDDATNDLNAVVAERSDFYRTEATLWLYYVSVRRGRPDSGPLAAELARLGERWPAPLLRLMLGQADFERVLAEAAERDRDPGAIDRQGRLRTCEVQFFAAVAAEARNDKAAARRLYGAVQSCDPKYRTRWLVSQGLASA